MICSVVTFNNILHQIITFTLYIIFGGTVLFNFAETFLIFSFTLNLCLDHVTRPKNIPNMKVVFIILTFVRLQRIRTQFDVMFNSNRYHNYVYQFCYKTKHPKTSCFKIGSICPGGFEEDRKSFFKDNKRKVHCLYYYFRVDYWKLRLHSL